jgi:general secretion pathway protein G
MLQRLIDRVHRGDRNDAGFTLIELLVVITILGILAAIVVFSVSGLGDKGQKSACQTDTSTLRTAEEAYYAGHSTYVNENPTTPALVTAGLLSTNTTLHTVQINGTGATATYQVFTAANGTTASPNVCGGPNATSGGNDLVTDGTNLAF